jgi:hypothetical protein
MSAYRFAMLPVWLLGIAAMYVIGGLAALVGKIVWALVLIAQADFQRLRYADVRLRFTAEKPE